MIDKVELLSHQNTVTKESTIPVLISVSLPYSFVLTMKETSQNMYYLISCNFFYVLTHSVTEYIQMCLRNFNIWLVIVCL